ncbi:glycine receptor subunit alpha-2-like [Mizuhopecten yessoensis]|uniref:Gamma-aminobutyric acid receptor subunit beta n=1 Tax=Mizuhopecten yessoensis TaxID=6573 RepID=A0A210QR28_MIZYE|nr:glycine receptor subunit alpha-2-like [Mizuhopecten yessoensis]OWF51197.1 Glycine receptor subunit alpha-2 [Mizuhopecten yessoensis]
MDAVTTVRWLCVLAQLGLTTEVLATDSRTKRSNNQKTEIVDQISSSNNYVYRPNYNNQGKPVIIECDLHINSIDSVTEVEMEFTAEVTLHLTWRDARLDKQFKNFNVEFVELGAKKMENFWVPDIFFPNEKRAAFHNVMSANKMIRIHKNSLVHYTTRLSLTLSCPMNLRKYPFDQQTCSIKIESFGFTKSQLSLKWSNSTNPLLVKKGMELPQFQLVGNRFYDLETFSKIRGNYSSLKADFFMVRNINYYVIQMYIPSLLIVMLSWVSFWLNVNSVPGRVNLGVLSVLTISTQSSSVNRTLPRVSYTKAIDIWMAACLVFVVAALVEFAIANVLSRRGSGKGMMFIKKIIKLARDKNRSTENSKGGIKPEGSGVRHRDTRTVKDTVVGVDGSVQVPKCQHLTIEDDDTKKTSPKKTGVVYAFYLDVASRIMFPLSFGIFNLVYWIYYLNIMNDIME